MVETKESPICAILVQEIQDFYLCASVFSGYIGGTKKIHQEASSGVSSVESSGDKKFPMEALAKKGVAMEVRLEGECKEKEVLVICVISSSFVRNMSSHMI